MSGLSFDSLNKTGRNTALAAAILLGINAAQAKDFNTDFNADKLMTQMKPSERYTFIAGVIEGLAVARYMRDDKKSEGMNCIYDWFYDDKTNSDLIEAAFLKFPAYPPGSVVRALVAKKCGD